MNHPLKDAAWLALIGPLAAVVCFVLIGLAALSDWWEGAL